MEQLKKKQKNQPPLTSLPASLLSRLHQAKICNLSLQAEQKKAVPAGVQNRGRGWES